jgi:alanyl-tRNA synthetase
MLAQELRQKYLDFFSKKHGHKVILGSSLLPENDPTVLFTTAGMHPLVPYLLGEKHPEGTRLVDVQKCVRTDDIEEVGDPTHCTFFEMLGNWSLGDYFKAEAIQMSYEFMTKELGLDPKRLMVTCFEGDENAPRDDEAAGEWEKLGFKRAEDAPNEKQLIFFYEKKKNWWGPAGQTGPCGPDTEMFYDLCPELPVGQHREGASADLIARYPLKNGSGRCHPNCECGRYVEIWNDVFMQYNKTEDGRFEPLQQQNVDTGMGLERVTAILQGKATHYDTELFESMIKRIRALSKEENTVSERIVADHIRSAVFIIGDERGVTPSNNDQGYVLRKLIRRAIRHGRKLGIQGSFTVELARLVIGTYGDFYKELPKYEQRILDSLKKEEEQFQEALTNGEAEISKDIEKVDQALHILLNENNVARLEMALNILKQTLENEVLPSGENKDDKILTSIYKDLSPVLGKMRSEFKNEASNKTVDEAILSSVRESVKKLLDRELTTLIVSGKRAFYYFESFGFPLEMTIEMLKEKGLSVDQIKFNEAFSQHQEKSRLASGQKFAGGLADHSFETKKLHTATHLMLEALRRVLGKTVEQKGSNITQERLRFDFNYEDKLSPEQIAEVEKLVNDAIQADYPIHWEEMSVEEARKIDATGVFVDKYEGELAGRVKVYFMGDYSKEICGGPHVDHTGQLGGHFKIVKEESSSSGIRRVKAILE